MAKVVYVGEPGGENLDVARETGGNAGFQPGDAVEVSDELAARLDASWVSEDEAANMDIEPIEDEETPDDAAEGGDE